MDKSKYCLKTSISKYYSFCFAVMYEKQICMWLECRLCRKYLGLFSLDIANKVQLIILFIYLIAYLFWSYFSALIKQVNKSIDGTADDEDEGVPTDQAIRAGLELLKVNCLSI